MTSGTCLHFTIQTAMSEKNLCHVTVVLLCMGRGGDPNAYRPNRDESQWWSRRDALVRCVASFLFGPSSAASKSMILIFDDDRAKMYLSSSGSAGSAVPTEQTILSLFKHAAQSLNSTVWKDGLSCRIVIDPTLTKDSKGKSNCCPGLPNGLDSKRELLEYLQQNCSIDFLRTNGLNSNPKVILRKTNKKALMDIWGNWRRQHNSEKGQGSIKKEFSDETAIESLYSEILTEFQQECANQNPIVGILHETCIEFPCFGWGKEDNEVHNDKKLRVLMFLGAVR